MHCSHPFSFFFFNDTATTEIYTLSLHDALPIWNAARYWMTTSGWLNETVAIRSPLRIDRKSTRLNSSHGYISYAVFCLKKKKADLDHRKTRSVTFYISTVRVVEGPHARSTILR